MLLGIYLGLVTGAGLAGAAAGALAVTLRGRLWELRRALLLAGWMMGGLALAAPLLAGAGLKVIYDLLLFASFRHLRPPGERGAGPPLGRATPTG